MGEKMFRRWKLFGGVLLGRFPFYSFMLNVLPSSWVPEKREARERAEMKFQVVDCDQYRARDFLKPDSIVIDGGASVGFFSRFTSELCPRGEVYSFEPNPQTFREIRKNKNVHAFNVALGDKKGQVAFLIDGSIGGNFIKGSSSSAGKTEIQVPVTTIDSFISENHIPRVDFIKIDTEGFEREVINGAKDTIRKFKPIISMSGYHKPKDTETLPALVKSIADYRFEIERRMELVIICIPV